MRNVCQIEDDTRSDRLLLWARANQSLMRSLEPATTCEPQCVLWTSACRGTEPRTGDTRRSNARDRTPALS